MKKEKLSLLVDQYLNEQDLLQKIDYQDVEKYCDQFLMMRLRGTQVRFVKRGMIIHGWMVNIVSMSKNIIRLPLMLTIVINQDNTIQKVNILNEFKGSQGVLCSKKYLQRKLDQLLVGTEFNDSNPLIKDEKELSCLHLQEILRGAISFSKYCKKESVKCAYESENSYYYAEGENLKILERQKSDVFSEILAEISFPNARRQMKFDDMFHMYLAQDQKMKYVDLKGLTGCKETVLQRNKNVHREILRGILPVYHLNSKKIMGEGRVLFTCLLPKSFIGLLTEAVALMNYSQNYIYFQQCLLVLQRKDNLPKCIGAIRDIQEGQDYFQMEKEDLFD